MIPLPPRLLEAVSSPGGGKIALVLGAGCSVEWPTNIPVSSECSTEIHRRLVADRILLDGDCENPSDLSAVADVVFAKRNSQRDVVERLRDEYDLKLATPIDGYWIAAALLFEGVISSVVTLNYDLALSMPSVGSGRAKLSAWSNARRIWPTKRLSIYITFTGMLMRQTRSHGFCARLHSMSSGKGTGSQSSQTRCWQLLSYYSPGSARQLQCLSKARNY